MKILRRTCDFDILLLLSSGWQIERALSKVTNARDHISANAAVDALKPYKRHPTIYKHELFHQRNNFKSCVLDTILSEDSSYQLLQILGCRQNFESPPDSNWPKVRNQLKED